MLSGFLKSVKFFLKIFRILTIIILQIQKLSIRNNQSQKIFITLPRWKFSLRFKEIFLKASKRYCTRLLKNYSIFQIACKAAWLLQSRALRYSRGQNCARSLRDLFSWQNGTADLTMRCLCSACLHVYFQCQCFQKIFQTFLNNSNKFF